MSYFLNPERQVFSVVQYNEYINEVISLSEVLVDGEVSNYREVKGRNFCYFDIKDELAIAKCFQGFWRSKPVNLKNGKKVRVLGFPSLQKNGSFVIDAREVILFGEGDLIKSYQELKIKLAGEGFFDAIHKKDLPKFPIKIGLIAGKNSSAYYDVVTELTERWPGVIIKFMPVRVQGVYAKKEVVEAVEFFNQYQPVDVLIIARGGGSMEELWAFDSEEVVRVVFGSKIPIISAIGHEDHWTLVDFVSDVRAKTPTKAAQLAVPDKQEVLQKLDYYSERMSRALFHELELLGQSLEELFFKIKHHYEVEKEAYLSKLNFLEKQAIFLIHQLLEQEKNELKKLKLRLLESNPLYQLANGKVFIELNGQRISNVKDAKIGDELKIVLQNGFFLVNIKNKKLLKKNYGKGS